MENTIDREAVLRGYIAAALWSSNDESTPQGGEPLDRNYDESNLSKVCRNRMKADVEKFCAENEATLSLCTGRILGFVGYADAPEEIGHDLWLNRNGHGCGFWEADYCTKEQGEVLSKAAKRMGECNLYVHRRKIHIY